jgi:hypothetical protein
VRGRSERRAKNQRTRRVYRLAEPAESEYWEGGRHSPFSLYNIAIKININDGVQLW